MPGFLGNTSILIMPSLVCSLVTVGDGVLVAGAPINPVDIYMVP